MIYKRFILYFIVNTLSTDSLEELSCKNIFIQKISYFIYLEHISKFIPARYNKLYNVKINVGLLQFERNLTELRF